MVLNSPYLQPIHKSWLFFILFSFPLIIEAQFSDVFSDGDFINNLTWNGDVSNFEVDTTKRLHTLYDTLDNEISLSTVSKISQNAVWQFKFEYLFYPSSSNYDKVYIMSDIEDAITTSEFWNGTNKKNISLHQGMYIVVVDVLPDNGFVNQYKKVVILQR